MTSDIEIEVWKTCVSHPRYEASSFGRVRMIGKKCALKPWKNKSGHLYLRLGGVSCQVHRAVIDAFGPPRPDKAECRHLDGNPENNRPENLCWGSRAENIADYRILNGRHMRTNSTPVDVATRIFAEHDGKRGTGKKLAEKYGVSVYTVSEIRNRKTFKYL